jgi:hypothetical protein
MLEQLLDYIKEDKVDNFATTSKRFKADVWNFFKQKFPESNSLNCCEFGTHKGQTTYILSHLFRHVYTINISESNFTEARKLNRDRDNIFYIPLDLYAERIEYTPIYEEIDVFFVDAGHDKKHVCSDIERIKKMKPNRPIHIIFDDYGLIDGVRNAVNEYIERGELTKEHYIGYEAGHKFSENRILKHYEGIICVM